MLELAFLEFARMSFGPLENVDPLDLLDVLCVERFFDLLCRNKALGELR